jgi:ADP-heptose:LPS heptosyltransferase
MSFFNKAKSAASILVLDLGFLGDSVHLIPALQCISKNFPNAKIDVLLSEHIKDVLSFTPGLREVYGYPRFPKGPKWYEHGPWLKFFKEKKYDAVINLNGSSRSSILTFLTRAKYRLGRGDDKNDGYIRYCYTEMVNASRIDEPIYRQNLKCLEMAGFPSGEYPFVQEIPEGEILSIREKFSLPNDFVHLSPFTNNDYKELPAEFLAKVLNACQAQNPYNWVVSCANNQRELKKMQGFLQLLNFKPALVLDGKASVKELIAIIHKAKIHLGGDSGALHLARMTNTPTLSWFREYEGIKAWLPEDDCDTYFIGQAKEEGLEGIDFEEFLLSLENKIKSF